MIRNDSFEKIDTKAETKKIFYFYPTRTLFRYFHFKKIVFNFLGDTQYSM